MANTGRKRRGVDSEAYKRGVLHRLKRIEGQVRGLQRMVEEDRYCVDVITQLNSVQEALRAVSREVLRSHLTTCAAPAIRRGGSEADEVSKELLDLMVYLPR